MKKVLIISYYWVPSGGAGVQRWVKFVKYLRQFGWEPVLYVPDNPEYPSVDNSFVKDIPEGLEVIKRPIWEPYNIYRSLFGKKGEAINAGFISENKKSGWKEKLSIWIRGNFLIPDPRKFWIKPSIRYLKKYIADNNVDAVITTGPPHSMHLIGLGLKKLIPQLKWVADFRDPWTNIDFYADLNLMAWADKKHRKLEKKVIQLADAVLVVSNGMKEEFELLKPQKLFVLTNGFDTDTETYDILLDSHFSLAHVGTLNAARNPKVLWQVLADLCKENPEFRSDLRILLAGKTDFSVVDAITKLDMAGNLIKSEYMPHSEAIRMQHQAQILLLLINNSANAKGILTGKFFEYLAAQRPILAVGPTDGDVAQVLTQTQAGVMVDFDDYQSTYVTVNDYYKRFKTGKLNIQPASINRFSRQKLTEQLVEYLNELIQK